MVELAEADPEVSEIEVRDLREDLARELERLASADIRASRGRGARYFASDASPRDGETP